MSRSCAICGKRPTTGNMISHSHRKTRRRWEPNLLKTKVELGRSVIKTYVCAKCLKKGLARKVV